jgi:hypothetical protein
MAKHPMRRSHMAYSSWRVHVDGSFVKLGLFTQIFNPWAAPFNAFCTQMHMSGFVETIILQNELSLCILLDVEVYVYGRALRTWNSITQE